MKSRSSFEMNPLLIGVTGGTASGKTSLCKYLLIQTYTFILSKP
jgi:uridine kinase